MENSAQDQIHDQIEDSDESSPQDSAQNQVEESIEDVQDRNDENNEKFFELVSSDAVTFSLSASAMRQSGTMAGLLDNKITEGPIPIMNVNGTILEMVIEWCEEHKNWPIPDEDDKVEITDWQANFFLVDNDTLFEVICAANFLDIGRLMDASCKHVAEMAKGRNPEQLRIIFGIQSDREEEEEEEQRAMANAAATRSGVIEEENPSALTA